MKLILLFVLSLATLSILGQKTKTNTATIDFVHYPTTPVKDVQKIGIQVYTANLPFNKDTLRLYLGNMDMMMSDVEQLSKVDYKSLNEVNISGGAGDISVHMAFGKPVIVAKEQKTYSCAPAKEGCIQYFYKVKYRLPAIVQFRNSSGIISTLELNPEMDLQFGNEQIEKHKKLDNGSSTSIQVLSFKSEVDLALAFKEMGSYSLARKGILKQIGQMSEIIYDNVFFKEEKLKLEIAYGTGKVADYTETEIAAETAINALESKDYISLQSSIEVWESWLKRYESEDKKAAVNKDVAQGLHKNLSIGYTFIKSFQKAKNHLNKAIELAEMGFVNTNEVNRLKEFYKFIERREQVEKHNADLQLTSLVTAPNIKKLLGQRKFNEDINFLIAEDKFAELQKDYSKVTPTKDVSEMTIDEFLNQQPSETDEKEEGVGEISLEGRVENDMLILSGIVDANMRGKALPKSICEYSEIKVIRARNIGLTSLPLCMRELMKLEKMYINSNTFEELPDIFENMKSLTVLDISNNNLKSLPPSIYTLTHLDKIYVSGNQLSEEDMKKLKQALPETKFK
jgi:hypothetical protein